MARDTTNMGPSEAAFYNEADAMGELQMLIRPVAFGDGQKEMVFKLTKNDGSIKTGAVPYPTVSCFYEALKIMKGEA